ncbi:hypothetical protein D3C86_1698790 [compost metagenome]
MATEHGVDFGVTGVNAQTAGVEGNELVHRGNHDDVFAPGAADHLGADLLITASEQAAMAAKNADDDPGLMAFHETDQRLFVEVRANKRAVHDRVDAKQGRRQTEFGHHPPRRGAGPHQVKATCLHLADDLSGHGV